MIVYFNYPSIQKFIKEFC